MKRREFIRRMERGAAGLLCTGMPGALVGCSGIRYVSARHESGRLVVARSAIGESRHVLLEHPTIPRAVYLHRHPDDSFSAVLTRCTHQGCQVEPAGDRLACPCHGSQYRITGEVLRGPAERPLQRYPVVADAESIVINLSSEAP